MTFKRFKWTVYLKNVENYVKIFVFYDYDDVQNLIGYMMTGSDFISVDIKREAINE